MEVTLLWLQLAASAAIILGASTFLAKSADVIAFKTGLGRSFIGVVLLATATSLPELGTGVSSIVLVGEPDLAAGDAFGSNLFNLLIIGLLDLYWRDGPILTKVNTTSVVVAACGIAVITLATIAILVHGMTSAMDGWQVSPVSILILAMFLLAMFLIYRVEQSQDTEQPKTGEGERDYSSSSLGRAALTYTLSAAIVVGAAMWLANSGGGIADVMGWEASFVGTQFLAFSTSLPELAASFAAIRIGAPELAISNVLGSNVFNMGFILFLDDVAYTGGAIWANIAEVHSLTAVIAVLMTAVVIVALVARRRGRPGKFWTFEAVSLIGLYAVASILVFGLG